MSTFLTDPPPAEPAGGDLAALVTRLERAVAAMESVTGPASQATPAIAMAADAADEFVRRAADRGVDVDRRLHQAVHLLERLTDPHTTRALELLLDRLPQLEQLLALADQAPGFVAMGVDTMDELVREGAFTSGMLDPNVVQMIGRMGASLNTAANARPEPVGLVGALGALRNPDVKQALGLLLTFAAEFGRQLDVGTQGRVRS